MKKHVAAVFFSVVFAYGAIAQTPFPVKPSQEKENREAKPTQPNYGPPKQNIVKMNLLSPIYGTIMLFYQRNINADNSVQLGCGYMNFDGLGSRNSTVNPHTESFYITPEYRYMLTGKNMNGTFIAPFMKYSNMTYWANYNGYYTTSGGPPYSSYYYNDRCKFNYQTLGIGFCLGQQVIYRNKISIEVFAGPVYNMLLQKKITVPATSASHTFSDVEIDESINTINVKGYGLRGGFTIGFLF